MLTKTKTAVVAVALLASGPGVMAQSLIGDGMPAEYERQAGPYGYTGPNYYPDAYPDWRGPVPHRPVVRHRHNR
jgi:hypothetical protein